MTGQQENPADYLQLFESIADPRQLAYLAALVKTGRQCDACDASLIPVGTVQLWKRQSSEFVAAVQLAQQLAAENLIDEAIRRATEGERRYKFDRHGDPLIHPETGEHYFESSKSDQLLIFLLKKLRPEQFGDKVVHEGTAGGPIQSEVTIKGLSVEHVDDWYPVRKPNTETPEERQQGLDALHASLGVSQQTITSQTNGQA